MPDMQGNMVNIANWLLKWNKKKQKNMLWLFQIQVQKQ